MARYENCEKCYHRYVCGGDVDKRSYYGECSHYINSADVVPKSEVEKWFRECEVLQGRFIELEKEVAREIFEEIEKALSNAKYRAKTPRKTVKVEELIEQANWILHEAVPNILAPLKKKYTESEDKE